MRLSRILVAGLLFGLTGAATSFAAEPLKRVVCNNKTEPTNIREGASAKNFSVIEMLPNGYKIEVLTITRNSEGGVWSKINFKSPYSPMIRTGWINSEAVAETCGQTAEKKPSPEPAAQSAAQSAPAPKADPIFQKDGSCKGYKIPISALSKAGVLTVDLSGGETFAVSCSTSGCGSIFNSVQQPSLTVDVSNLKVPGVSGTCRYDVKFICADSRGSSGDYYVQGRVGVNGVGNSVGLGSAAGCPPARQIVIERDVFFHGGDFFVSESAYNASVTAKREAADRKAAAEEAARRNAFAEKMKSFDGAQAIYLHAGELERKGDDYEAKRVYEYLISNHAATDWAVKANDRLLAMRADSDAARRASSIQSEISAARDQASQLCRNRRMACQSACMANNRSFADQTKCEYGCPSCN